MLHRRALSNLDIRVGVYVHGKVLYRKRVFSNAQGKARCSDSTTKSTTTTSKSGRSRRTKNGLSFGNADFHHLHGDRWYFVINERAATDKGEVGGSNLPRGTIAPNSLERIGITVPRFCGLFRRKKTRAELP